MLPTVTYLVSQTILTRGTHEAAASDQVQIFTTDSLDDFITRVFLFFPMRPRSGVKNSESSRFERAANTESRSASMNETAVASYNRFATPFLSQLCSAAAESPSGDRYVPGSIPAAHRTFLPSIEYGIPYVYLFYLLIHYF